MNYVETLQKQVESMATGLVQALPSLVIAIVILFVTFIAARSAVAIATRLTRATSIRDDLKQLLATLVRLAIWIAGIMIAATVAVPGMTPASLFAGLGVGALAIGFAFQDIFENFLAGVLIMLREKMHIGDLITVEGILGKVERITLRETHIRLLSGELTILPNSVLFKNPVEILTDQSTRRDQIVVGVSYDSDLDASRSAIRKALDSVEGIDQGRGIDILAQEFNSSSIDFLVRWWSDAAQRDRLMTKSDIIFAIKRELDAAGIEIPFPYVTHTFKDKVPVGDLKLAMERQDREAA
ncbi:mechanosensitive ion channel [Novosphingobium sp. ZN18A2]|uniref:mechanosensitive ion channel family protein n=1 Tax=Novosphingobium sp. ZN18A2 TaxID=3079861 RepID=UPI0030D10E82